MTKFPHLAYWMLAGGLLAGGLLITNGWPTTALAQSDQQHAEQDHEHDAHAEEERAGHEADPGHAEHDNDEHAGHDHGDAVEDHAGHDHGDENDGGTDHADQGDKDEDEHAGHGHDEEEEEEEPGIRLTPEVMREFGIVIERAGGGQLKQTVRLPGEVVYNADRIADVTPTVAGIAQSVAVSVGDRVETGEVLAVMSSRELAAARSDYLAAQARLELAKANFERDKRLFEEKVGTERAVIESRQALEEARINLQQAETSLHALGLTEAQIERTDGLEHGQLGEYHLLAPLSGMVTERELTIGEVVEPMGNGAPMVVADLSTVWVNLTVYQRDLAHVRAGQPVAIQFGHGIPDTDGNVAFVSPALDEATRTAFARIVLNNPGGYWRPGLFVEGVIETGHDTAKVVVPRSAVIGIDEQQVVFVKTEQGLTPRPVRLGRGTEQRVEVLSGLRPGEQYAATGVVTLKAQMNSAVLEHAGHAH